MIKTYLFTTEGTKENVSLDDWKSLVQDKPALLWVDVRSVDEQELNRLAELFGLHAIAVKSIVDAYHRPRLYEFEDHFYVNLTVLKLGRKNHKVKPSELHLFAGEQFIITVTREEKDGPVDTALAEYMENSKLAERGAIYAVYLLTEDLIETYFPIVEDLDNEADTLEDEMLERANKNSLVRLTELKRCAFELRRILGPQRDIFNELARRDFPFMTGENQVYFQDVYNRMIRVFDMLDTIREILSGATDIYLSQVSNRLNEIVKVLTVASLILMALSFIAGFYGMNFTHLPWLRSPNAFRNIILVMVGVVIAMLLWFKRKGWM